MAVAVSAAEAIGELTGYDPGLKWPNDVVWPGDGRSTDRKLAGILAEVDWPAGATVAGGWSEPQASDRLAVAVGIGINVAWGQHVPPELEALAVALDTVAVDVAVDRVDLLVAMLTRLETHYRALVASPEGAEALRSQWRSRSATLGRRVRVDLGAEDLEGVAVEVTVEGHLVVQTDEGVRRTVAVGDVVHLRPLS
jgi:BirA family biotin operon repressor/biotin-[acetyl-CoA-carboxylase] ligase